MSKSTFFDFLNGLNLQPNQVQATIDGLVYTSTKLPAMLCLGVWPKLTAMLGTPLVRAIATSGDDIWETLGGSLEVIAMRALELDVGPMLLDLMSGMQVSQLRNVVTKDPVGPVAPHFDAHFAGEYYHLLKVAAFAIAHNLQGPTLGGH